MKQCQTRGYREVWSWKELLITNSEPPVGCGWCVAREWLIYCFADLTGCFLLQHDSMNFLRTAAHRYSTMNVSRLSTECSPFTQAVVSSMRKL